MEKKIVTEQEIEAAKTENGGWTKSTLAGWGVSWPPPRGWKLQLIENASSAEANENGTSPLKC